MKIICDIKNSKLVTNDQNLLRELDEEFALFIPGYEYTDLFKQRRWDGKHHFLRRLTGSFPTGLLCKIEISLMKRGIQVEIVKNYVPISLKNPITPKLIDIELRDYQLVAVRELLKHLRGIVKYATNAGKTEVAAELIRLLNIPCLFIVDRKELLHQTAERLSKRLGVKVGKIGDGLRDKQFITVAMPQTLTRKVQLPGTKKPKLVVLEEFSDLMQYQLLILDECDTITDARIEKVVSTSNAIYRGAFSGTPLLNDSVTNTKLIGYFGEVIAEITNAELIGIGVSSVPCCRVISVNTPGIISVDYRKAYKNGIVNSRERNSKIRDYVEYHSDQGLNILIIVQEVTHINNLIKLIPKAVAVHGGMTSKDRRDIIKRFKNREIDILISSNILDRGVDISNIDVLILAAGGDSAKRVLQRIGRGLRAKESMKIEVIDFLDTGNYNLLDHSCQRISTMRSEGFKVELYEA